MPTHVVGMGRFFHVSNTPTTSVGMALGAARVLRYLIVLNPHGHY